MKKNKIIILSIIIVSLCFGTGALLSNIYKKSQKINEKSKALNKKMENEKKLSNKSSAKVTEENKNINIKEKRNKICIDPGHQEKADLKTEEIAPGSSQKKARVQGGATGVATKKPEYKLTLEIGLKLKDVLQSKGYDVFMVREKNDVNISNKERALMTNKAGCAVFLRLHADAGGSGATGASMITSSVKNPNTKAIQQSSDKFSKTVLEEYIKATGFKNRGISYRDDLTGTNWSTVTNTLIEMGFLSNPEDDKKMSSPKFQDMMVNGIVNGIEKYLLKK